MLIQLVQCVGVQRGCDALLVQRWSGRHKWCTQAYGAAGPPLAPLLALLHRCTACCCHMSQAARRARQAGEVKLELASLAARAAAVRRLGRQHPVCDSWHCAAAAGKQFTGLCADTLCNAFINSNLPACMDSDPAATWRTAAALHNYHTVVLFLAWLTAPVLL
jgi:hypothetical protein